MMQSPGVNPQLLMQKLMQMRQQGNGNTGQIPQGSGMFNRVQPQMPQPMSQPGMSMGQPSPDIIQQLLARRRQMMMGGGPPQTGGTMNGTMGQPVNTMQRPMGDPRMMMGG